MTTEQPAEKLVYRANIALEQLRYSVNVGYSSTVDDDRMLAVTKNNIKYLQQYFGLNQ